MVDINPYKYSEMKCDTDCTVHDCVLKKIKCILHTSFQIDPLTIYYLVNI